MIILQFILQCLHDWTVNVLSSHCCLANILRYFFFVFECGRTVPAVMWLRAQIFRIALRWHFAGRQLPAVGFPRKIVLAPLICDLGITWRIWESDRLKSTSVKRVRQYNIHVSDLAVCSFGDTVWQISRIRPYILAELTNMAGDLYMKDLTNRKFLRDRGQTLPASLHTYTEMLQP